LIKVVIPHIEVNRIARRGLLAPQLACTETHGVYVLGILTTEMGVRVWQDKNAMVAFDRAELPAGVTRQSGVTNWIYIPGAHALAHLEARGHLYIPAGGQTFGN
jgi:hypothetical protein